MLGDKQNTETTKEKADGEKAKKFDELATQYEEKGKFDKAEEAYKLAIKYDPENPDYYYNYGSFLRKSNKLEEAKSQIEIAIKLQPDDAWNYSELGLVSVSLSDWDQAVNAFKKSAELSETPDPRIFYNLGDAQMDKGKALLEQGDFANALGYFSASGKSYMSALELEPTGKLEQMIINSLNAVKGLHIEAIKQKNLVEELEAEISKGQQSDKESSEVGDSGKDEKKEQLPPPNSPSFGSSKVERTGFGRVS